MRQAALLTLAFILALSACAPRAGTNAPQPGAVVSATPTPQAGGMSPSDSPPDFPSDSPSVSKSDSPLQQSAPASVSPAEMVARMGRGVNLGNTLEAPREGEWGFKITAEHFDLIRSAGFTAVRIPIRWSAHAAETAPYTIDPAFFTRIDQVTTWALARGLIVVINIHHYEEMTTTPRRHQERFLALWQQIAEHYQDAPSELLFELMNEPNGLLSAALWNETAASAIQIIRQSNPTRNLVVGGVNWNAWDQLRHLTLPQDDHLIATFHYYNPFQFTHQGAEWAPGSDAWLGTTWDATPAQTAEVDAHFDAVAAWSAEHNIPIFLGEFGAYSKAPQPSRITWTSYIARAAEQRGFAWAYWEFGAGFGIYDRAARRWRDDLLKALMP